MKAEDMESGPRPREARALVSQKTIKKITVKNNRQNTEKSIITVKLYREEEVSTEAMSLGSYSIKSAVISELKGKCMR